MTEKELRNALSEYRELRSAYNDELRRIEELEAQSTATKSLSDLSERVMSSSANGARYEPIIIDKVDLEHVLASSLAEVQQAKARVADLIAQADTRKQRFILRCRYIDCLSFERIAKVTNYSEDHVYTTHRKAINSILRKHNSS